MFRTISVNRFLNKYKSKDINKDIMQHNENDKKSCDMSNKTLDLILQSSEDTSSEELIDNRYKLYEELGSGSFGTVYRATDLNNFEYAIKFEPMTDIKKHLYRENIIYDQIKGTSFQHYFPKKYYYGNYKNHRVLVLEKLGISLKSIFNNYEKFDLQTVSNIGVQILYRLENLHSIGWLHQDIKPENILLDPIKGKKLYLLDFGTSGRWCNADMTKHIPYERSRKIVGTARYSSLNNHIGIKQSRKDDLESLGYVLLYFIIGRLPWQGIKAKDFRTKWNKIKQIKEKINIISLCEDYNLDISFIKFFKYIFKLKFDEKPDYQYLRSLFRKNIKHNFFWSLSVE